MQNIYQAKVDDSTLDDITAEEDNRGRRRLRLTTLLAVAALVLMALIGAFDQKKTTGQRAGNLEVQVEYPSVVRAGNEIQLRIALSSPQPLPETVKLSVSEDYLTLFEDFSAFPEPESQASRGDGTVEFEVSPATESREMVATLTGRASDQWNPRTKGALGITAEDTQITLDIETWRTP
ncbi:hypothetical protein [Glutamicibacter halophytocola]|uniref:hypothetical protein n=1 Tax=Glutamicibacter halophytocola TaxID=1933880 RepID=UPI0015C5792D|nr:hypothetical protein [Glutamicibacter halophytocola]NQD40855.1 hypothetical protein [Glutamicibacter halophytocola]